MMTKPPANLVPHSRVWIFQSDRFLKNTEADLLHQKMQAFIPQWAAHGNELFGAYALHENLFLIVGVDESRSPASGCSIDTLTRQVKEIGAELGIDFFNRLAIAYENEAGIIEIVSMNEFKRMILENKVNQDTIVFNNLVGTKDELDTKWKTSVSNSWHTNLFQLV